MTRHELTYQIRYAIRLTERTARLYRNLQTLGVFLTVLGGSAILSLLSGELPVWVGLAGAFLFSASGAALIAVRPADKAAMNEADVQRYRALLTRSHRLTDGELAEALAEAREADCPEIELLCDVAWNDTVTEYGREDAVVPLRRAQRLLAALAG